MHTLIFRNRLVEFIIHSLGLECTVDNPTILIVMYLLTLSRSASIKREARGGIHEWQ